MPAGVPPTVPSAPAAAESPPVTPLSRSVPPTPVTLKISRGPRAWSATPGFTSRLPGVIAVEMPPFFCLVTGFEVLTFFCHNFEGPDILINGEAASGFQRRDRGTARTPIPAPAPSPARLPGLFPHTFQAFRLRSRPREPLSSRECAPNIEPQTARPEARGARGGGARAWAHAEGTPAPGPAAGLPCPPRPADLLP